METNFGASVPYTVGVEEEFQLVDAESFGLTPVIDTVLAARDAAGLPASSVTSELSASCLEMRSPVCTTVAELAPNLASSRRKVRELVEGCGARLAAAGTHPFSDALSQPITGDERYLRVVKEMGWTARMQAIYGLHVHVAVPDEDTAIRAVNTLSRHVPLFVALSTNSPFWGGTDTRLASARVKVFGLVPRTGLPPRFRSWEDFEGYVDTLVASKSIPNFSWCWWDVRPHPALGTVELRAPDAQTEVARTASLVALAQCLVATSDEYSHEDPLITEENKWRAARYGLDAQLYDFWSGNDYCARDVAGGLVRSLIPISQELGCEAELEGVLDITKNGTGAEKQRAIFAKRNSTKDVAVYLVAATAEA